MGGRYWGNADQVRSLFWTKPAGQFTVTETGLNLIPQKLIRVLLKISTPLRPFDRVSVGFPGVIKNGKIITSPHFPAKEWRNYNLKNKLSTGLKKPVCVLNDADLLGFGVIRKKGLELVLTLGTGIGTALYRNGQLMPRMELSHHPIAQKLTYNQFAGDRALRKVGLRVWRTRMRVVIQTLHSLLHYDRLFILGGNASKLKSLKGQPYHLVSQFDALKGGVFVWNSISVIS